MSSTNTKMERQSSKQIRIINLAISIEVLGLYVRVSELEMEDADLLNHFLPTENLNDQRSILLNAYAS